MRIAVIVPAYGQHHLTREVAGDVARESAAGPHHLDLLVVDNGGDYVPRGDEAVIRPGRNLGWLGGTNVGWERARSFGYDAYVLLNNDVRLSRGFFTGLAAVHELTGAGIVAPVYDGWLAHQHVPFTRPAADWRPRRRHWRTKWVDGTCMLVSAAAVQRVGTLDPRYVPHGWGAEADYCLRVDDAGLPIVITALSFLHHLSSATANELHGGRTYHREALVVAGKILQSRYDRLDLKERIAIDWKIGNTHPLSRWQRLRETAVLEISGRRAQRRRREAFAGQAFAS